MDVCQITGRVQTSEAKRGAIVVRLLFDYKRITKTCYPIVTGSQTSKDYTVHIPFRGVVRY
jgi:hypothetical protein